MDIMQLEAVIDVTRGSVTPDAEALFHCLRLMRDGADHTKRCEGVIRQLKKVNSGCQQRLLEILDEIQNRPLATAVVAEGDELPFPQES